MLEKSEPSDELSPEEMTLEKKRAADLKAILDGRLRAGNKIKYGIYSLSENPDCYTLRIVDEYSRPLALFKIDFEGEIVGEFENDQIKVWKDPRQEIPLTPEDIIEAINETRK